MKEQFRSELCGKDIRPKPIAEALTNSEADRVKKCFLDMPALIRSIQRAEGNIDCFRKVQGYCEQLECTWRQYCL